jgi:hypothetical protein
MAQPESRLRARCRMLLDSHLPAPCWFTAIEHGRKHSGTAEQRARQWQHLKAQGVKQGVADLLILAPGFALMVELKAAANKQSPAQLAMQQAMARLGHGYAVVRSVEQLGEAMQDAGVPLAVGWRIKAQLHDLALAAEAPARKKPARKLQQKPTARQIAAGNRAALVGVKP